MQAVFEILGQQDDTVLGDGSRDDEAVPSGETVTVFDLPGLFEKSGGRAQRFPIQKILDLGARLRPGQRRFELAGDSDVELNPACD